MKRTKWIISILALTLAIPSFADDKADEAKKQERMKKWMEYSTPNDNHKVFAQMVGKWKYTSKMWEKADSQPQESSGMSTMKVIMGGRFLQHETKGKTMGMPFEGMGLTGYDNMKKEYQTLWVDNMSTGMMIGAGKYDADNKILSDKGEYNCPMADSKKMEYRTEMKIVDKNHMTYSMYGEGLDGGKEFKQMELTFTRK